MPPKKKVEEEQSPMYLGRFGTSLKIGIVGVPNVGKSTFFNVLCKQVRLIEASQASVFCQNEAIRFRY